MTDYADKIGQVMTDDEMEDIFQEWLDEFHGQSYVAGYSMSTGRILREVDYTAFREEFNNWLDSECQNGEILDLSLSENTTCDTCNGDLTQEEAVTSFTDETGPICTTCLDNDDEEN